jgi:hypothetical protein
MGTLKDMENMMRLISRAGIVAIEFETRAERGDHELHELAKPVAKSPLIAGRCITTSDRLEVL